MFRAEYEAHFAVTTIGRLGTKVRPTSKKVSASLGGLEKTLVKPTTLY